MSLVTLKGITWNHSRALPPLVATAQRYEELNPGVRIHWEKRTLHEFGHASLADLAERYDLLVIDHPMMGEAEDSLVDLAPLLGAAQMERLAGLYVGPSFASYRYDDSIDALYALPIDAAAPAACYRADLLARADSSVPRQWDQLLALARRGLVRMPGFPADLFLNWMGLCVSMGSKCATSTEQLFDQEIAMRALDDLRLLASTMPDAIYEWNPIALYEAMAAGDDFAYCLFAYTYSNYARAGFAANLLRFTNPVSLSDGAAMRTVLGGTGIAISKCCTSIDVALQYSLFVAAPQVQRNLYGLAGGQPAACTAWDDPLLNQVSADFFTSTRSSIDTAYVRPRYRGYIALQEAAGVHVAGCLRGKAGAKATLDAIDQLYRQSLDPSLRKAQTVEQAQGAHGNA